MYEARDSIDDLVEATRGPQPWRRIFHALNGLFFAGLLWTWGPTRGEAVLALGSIVLLLLAGDILRLALPWLNALFFRVFQSLASPREADGIASSTWYMVGILVAVALFPLDVVVPGILVLALADPAASYLGRRWGRRRIGTGSLEGMAVFAVIAGTILLVTAPPGSALLAAVGAAAVEVVPWDLDDNLTIPLTVALILWVTGAAA